MEPLLPTINLLTKFSHCSNIIKYYGKYHESKLVLMSLWKETNEVWKSNAFAFRNTFEEDRRLLEYSGRFNEDFIAFLLEDEKYKMYSLKIKLIENEEIKLFCDFIKSYKLKEITFKEILIEPFNTYFTDLKHLNLPYETLIQEGLDTRSM